MAEEATRKDCKGNLLGTVTVLFTLKSETNKPHTELFELNIWLAAAVTPEEVDCHESGW